LNHLNKLIREFPLISLVVETTGNGHHANFLGSNLEIDASNNWTNFKPVVPRTVSNALILSAQPQSGDRLLKLITQKDYQGKEGEVEEQKWRLLEQHQEHSLRPFSLLQVRELARKTSVGSLGRPDRFPEDNS
jgi:hypothetical protein